MTTKVIQPNDLNSDHFEIDATNKIKVKFPERLVSGLSVEGSKIIFNEDDVQREIEIPQGGGSGESVKPGVYTTVEDSVVDVNGDKLLEDAVKLPEAWDATVNFNHLKELVVEELTISGRVSGPQDFSAYRNLKKLTFADATNLEADIIANGSGMIISAPNAVRVGKVLGGDATVTHFPSATHVVEGTLRGDWSNVPAEKLIESKGQIGIYIKNAPSSVSFPNLLRGEIMTIPGVTHYDLPSIQRASFMDTPYAITINAPKLNYFINNIGPTVRDLVLPSLLQVCSLSNVARSLIAPICSGYMSRVIEQLQTKEPAIWLDLPRVNIDYSGEDKTFSIHLKTTLIKIRSAIPAAKNPSSKYIFYVPEEELAAARQIVPGAKPYSEWSIGSV